MCHNANDGIQTPAPLLAERSPIIAAKVWIKSLVKQGCEI